MTTTPAPLPALPTDPAILVERQRILDLAVRKARAEGYCDRTERVLQFIMPEMAAHDGRFYDTEGVNCQGAKLTAARYNRNGYDQFTGCDRDGYNTNGSHTSGIDPTTGYTRAFDVNGYDVHGYDRYGTDVNQKSRKARAATAAEVTAEAVGPVNPTTALLVNGVLVAPPAKKAPAKVAKKTAPAAATKAAPRKRTRSATLGY